MDITSITCAHGNIQQQSSATCSKGFDRLYSKKLVGDAKEVYSKMYTTQIPMITASNKRKKSLFNKGL